MGKEINLDDGYTIRVHPLTGMDIYMPKATPGVYLNGHGDEINSKLAKEAGFDTDALAREKERRSKISEAADAINKLYEGAGKEKVVKSRRGYTLVDIGLDRFVVKDPGGVALNQFPVSGAVSEKLFDQVVPPEQPKKAEAAPLKTE